MSIKTVERHNIFSRCRQTPVQGKCPGRVFPIRPSLSPRQPCYVFHDPQGSPVTEAHRTFALQCNALAKNSTVARSRTRGRRGTRLVGTTLVPMSIFSRIAQRLTGATRSTGRDLQLRAETLLVYSLATRSTPIFGDYSPNVLSRCAELINSNSYDLPSFEEQATTVRSFLTESLIKTLNVTSEVINQAKWDDVPSFDGRVKERLGFVPNVAKSSIPNAGAGLFVEGSAHAGALLGLYPGTCYMPSDLKHLPNYPKITDDNEYLIWRYDGIVLDGKDALPPQNACAEEIDERDVRETGVEHSELSHEEPQMCIRHPFALAHRINHPPMGKYPNCLQFMLDVRLTRTTRDLRQLIPNELYASNSHSLLERLHNMGVRQRVAATSAFTSNSVTSLSVPTLAIIATRDLSDEEVFMNYRYNPQGPDVPPWYHDCDPESSARRWMKSTAFF